MSKKLLRFHEVKKLVGLSRTTIWRLERQGKFPRRKQISENAVAWLDEEIQRWILEKSKGRLINKKIRK